MVQEEELRLYDMTIEDFEKFFYLSESSPSGLRWKVTTCSTATKDSVAGSFSETVKFPLWRTKLNKRGMIVSRIIWFMHYKQLPDILDHRDGNPKNNSISNLRNVVIKVNCENRVVKNSDHPGVYLVTTDHRGNTSWKCQGTLSNGQRWTRNFAVKKYGFDMARQLCIEYRKNKEAENNTQTREATLNDIR